MKNKYSGKKNLINAYLSFAAFLFSCTSSTPSAEVEAMNLNAGATLTIVSTAPVEAKRFEYLIHTNGKVKALRERLMTSAMDGWVAECKAETGKKAPLGFVVLHFDSTLIQHKLQKAQLTLFNAQKEYESRLLGYESLLKNRSAEEAEDIKQKLKVSSGLAMAELELKEAGYELSKTVVAAPFAGILADVKVQSGQRIAAGAELFRIYDPSSLLLEVKVLEADIAMLKIGMPALISPLPTPEVMIPSSVHEINPYVDENGLVMVRLKIHPTQDAPFLFPGMNATAVIKVPSARSLVAPKEAVVMRSGKAVAFTMENGKAKWNYIVIGRDNGSEVEIKEGLKQGQKVIITNNLQLAHDAPVKENESAK